MTARTPTLAAIPPVFYRARGNEIVDSRGTQVAVILASNCTKKLAREMAAYAAQQANHAARQREREQQLVAAHRKRRKDAAE